MKHFILVFLLLAPIMTNAGTLYVDSNADYTIQPLQWGLNNLPIQPDVEYRFGDGLVYDTSNGQYRNYGSFALPTSLTNGNTPSLQEGVLFGGQQSVLFDGVNDFLEIDDNTVLNVTTGDFSFAAIIRFESVPSGTQIIAGKTTPLPTYGYRFLLTSSGTISFATQQNSNLAVVTSSALTPKRWYFLVGTWTNSTNTSRFYLNGAIVNSGTNSNVNNIGNSVNFSIGRRIDGLYFNGAVCWLGFWNGAILDSANVASLYFAMFPDGSFEKPYPSLQTAIDQATNGDVILTHNGIYHETVNVHRQLVISALNSVPFLRPIFNGSQLISASGTNGFEVSAVSTLNFLNIKGYESGSAVTLSTGASNSLLEHLTISGSQSGIFANGQSGQNLKLTLNNNTIDGALSLLEGVELGDYVDTLWYSNNIIAFWGAGLKRDSGVIMATNNNYFGNINDFNNYAGHSTDLFLPARFLGQHHQLSARNPLLRSGADSLAVYVGAVPNGMRLNNLHRAIWANQIRNFKEK